MTWLELGGLRLEALDETPALQGPSEKRFFAALFGYAAERYLPNSLFGLPGQAPWHRFEVVSAGQTVTTSLEAGTVWEGELEGLLRDRVSGRPVIFGGRRLEAHDQGNLTPLTELLALLWRLAGSEGVGYLLSAGFGLQEAQLGPALGLATAWDDRVYQASRALQSLLGERGHRLFSWDMQCYGPGVELVVFVSHLLAGDRSASPPEKSALQAEVQARVGEELIWYFNPLDGLWYGTPPVGDDGYSPQTLAVGLTGETSPRPFVAQVWGKPRRLAWL